MTISALAQEMRSGFQAVREEVSGVRKEMREKFSGVENRVSGIEERLGGLESSMHQGFELVDAKIDAVDQKIEHKIEFLQEGLFTPDEKKSLFDTVKLVNDRLADNVVGSTDITLSLFLLNPFLRRCISTIVGRYTYPARGMPQSLD